jgi:hypothetical protein
VLAEARIREAKARANARVRGAQIEGLTANASVLMKRTGIAKDEPVDEAETVEMPAIQLTAEPRFDPAASGIIEAPNGRASRAMWNSMSLRERVNRSGLITAQEIAEVLAISQAHARKLMAEIRASESDQPAVPGRKGVPYQALIDALYTRRTSESFAQAQKLEKALGLRRRQRQGADNAEPTHPDHSGRTGVTVEYRPVGGLGISTQTEDQVGQDWPDAAYSLNGHSRIRRAAD